MLNFLFAFFLKISETLKAHIFETEADINTKSTGLFSPDTALGLFFTPPDNPIPHGGGGGVGRFYPPSDCLLYNFH